MGRVVLNEVGRNAAVEPGPAAERLQTAMLAALGAHTDAGGRVDYERLRGSEAFAEAERVARALASTRLDGLADRRDRLAFWINVYNALVLHGIVRLRVRASVRRARNSLELASYRIR